MNRIEFKGLKDESEGRIEVLSPRKTVEFTIEEYNELIDSPWALIDVFLKEGIRTTLWRHKETRRIERANRASSTRRAASDLQSRRD